MARPGVTYSEVAEAATKLNEKGENPTVARVIGITGGSAGTIGRHLKKWKTQQYGDVEAQSVGLPPDLITAVKGIYGAIQEKADTRIGELTAETEASIEAAKDEVRKIKEEYTKLQEELAQANKKISALEQTNTELEKALHNEKIEHTATKVRNDALETRLDDRQQEIKQLQGQLKQVEDNLHHYREEIKEQRINERADFDRQINNAEQQIGRFQQDIGVLQQDLRKRENEVSRYEMEQRQLQARFEALEKEFTQQKGTLLEKERAVNEMSPKLEYLEQRNIEQVQQNKELGNVLLELEKGRAVDREKIGSLSAALEKAELKNEELADQNAKLKQDNTLLSGKG